jgi:hypothetical protein
VKLAVFWPGCRSYNKVRPPGSFHLLRMCAAAVDLPCELPPMAGMQMNGTRMLPIIVRYCCRHQRNVSCYGSKWVLMQ